MSISVSPYNGLPDYSFWKRSVAIAPDLVDPVVGVKFTISRKDKIATAGSCFAQHIARSLHKSGYNYFVTEPGDKQRNFGVFSARFGNIYTCRQLLQLFRRAYALYKPTNDIWRRAADGAYVDAFRPQIEPAGFATAQDVFADRAMHMAAVRRMFEQCEILIFTLGLTEAWESTRDAAVFPLAPGVASAPGASTDSSEIIFRNFTVGEMVDDLRAFVRGLRQVNAGVRIILTVSPVPLIATYENRHVLVSNTFSKSALRVVADELATGDAGIDYFPSFEIITGPHQRYSLFADDMRSVLPEGVETVMRIFSNHYLAEAPVAERVRKSQQKTFEGDMAPTEASYGRSGRAEMEALYKIVCDEEAIEL